MRDKDQKLIYENYLSKLVGAPDPKELLLGQDEEEGVKMDQDEWEPEQGVDHTADWDDVDKLMLEIEVKLDSVRSGDDLRQLIRWVAHEIEEIAGEMDIGVEEGGMSTGKWILIDKIQGAIVDIWMRQDGADQEVLRALSDGLEELRPREG